MNGINREVRRSGRQHPDIKHMGSFYTSPNPHLQPKKGSKKDESQKEITSPRDNPMDIDLSDGNNSEIESSSHARSSSDEHMDDNYSASTVSPRSDSDNILQTSSDSPEPTDCTTRKRRRDESSEPTSKRRKVGEDGESYAQEISHEKFELHEQIKQLQEDLEAHKSNEEELRKNLRDANERLLQNPELIQKIQSLEEQLGHSQKARKDIQDALETANKELQQENDMREQLLSGTLQELRLQIEGHQAFLRIQEAEKAQFEGKVKDLEDQLKENDHQNTDAVRDLNQKITDLKKNIAQKEQQIEELENKIQEIRLIEWDLFSQNCSLLNQLQAAEAAKTNTFTGTTLSVLSSAAGYFGSYFHPSVKEVTRFFGGYIMDAIDALEMAAPDTIAPVSEFAKDQVSTIARFCISNSPYIAGIVTCIGVSTFLFAINEILKSREEIQLECVGVHQDEEMLSDPNMF